MKVLFVQNQLCTRGWKEARVLGAAGVELSLAELGCESPSKDLSVFSDTFVIPVGSDLGSMVRGKKIIIQELKRIADAEKYDIIHVHNEPDNLGVWIKRNLSVPVVHDIHDLVSLKPIPWAKGPKKWVVRRMYDSWEKKICRMADGILCPSAPMAEFIRDRYGPNRIEFVENKPVREDFTPEPKIDDGGVHMVYPGGISMETGGTRYLWPMFEKICAGGVNIHLYPPVFDEEKQKPVREKCESIKRLHFHPPVTQHRVIPEISRYHFGLVLFSSHTDNIKMATSNRVFEYQIAGLPVITNDRGNIAKYVLKKNCGEVIRDVEEIGRIVKDRKEYDLDTKDCYMDAGPILGMYKEVLE